MVAARRQNNNNKQKMEPKHHKTKKTDKKHEKPAAVIPEKEFETERRKKKGSGGFREKYGAGVDKYYTDHGDTYTNPHETALLEVIAQCIDSWMPKRYPTLAGIKVLDLACGSGEASLAFQSRGVESVVGCDPYTYKAFEDRTHLPVRKDTFMEIALGSMGDCKYDIIVCSYALHLAPVSTMSALCVSLAMISKYLLIVSPHKFPLMKESYGWDLQEELVEKRIHCRLFVSTLLK